jgi:hypothetical protein
MLLESIQVYSRNYLLIQQSENFQLVFNKNMITNVTIEEIQLIVALCYRLEYLTIRISTDFFVPILRFLLPKSNENIRHLFLLCILGVPEDMVNLLKTLIRSEKLFDDYSLKFIDNKLYLWWK